LTLQDSIDEENRTVLASLDQQRSSSPSTKTSLSPTSPQSPYARNTLTVDSSTPRHGSIAGIGVGVTSPTQSRKKRLNPADPSTWTSTKSPTENRPRASSESQSTELPTIQFEHVGEPKLESAKVESAIQAQSPASPITQRKGSGSMAAALSGDLGSLQIGPETSPVAQSNNALASPPTAKHLAPSPAALGNDSDEGTESRRFSNQSASFSTMTDDSDRIGAIIRDDDKGEEEAVQESSEEERSDSDLDEGSPVSERGRKRKSSRESSSPDASRDADTENTRVAPEIKGQPRLSPL